MSEKLTALCDKATRLSEQGDWDASITAWSEFIELADDPQRRGEAYYNRGKALLRKGDAELADGGFNSSNRYNRTIAVHAIADFSRALEILPEDAEVYIRRGCAYFHIRDVDLAIRDFDRVIELEPKKPDGYFRRGEAYSIKYAYVPAISDLTAALEMGMHPAWLVYNSRSRAHLRAGHFDSALSDMDAAIMRLPGSLTGIEKKDASALYSSRGVLLAIKGEFVRAFRDNDKAIRLARDSAIAYGNRGVTYISRGEFFASKDSEQAYRDHLNAINDLNRALELDQDYAVGYLMRGFAHLRLHRSADAFADILQANQKDPHIKATHTVAYVVHRIAGSVPDETARARLLYSFIGLGTAVYRVKVERFCEPGEFKLVTHYTSQCTSKKLAPQDGHFRLSNASRLNAENQNEGTDLHDVLRKRMRDDCTAWLYPEAAESRGRSPAFIGSFTAVSGAAKEDRQMWNSAYGKHGSGVCLVYARGQFSPDCPGDKIGMMGQLPGTDFLAPPPLPALYRVAYRSECASGRLSDALNELASALQKVKDELDALPAESKESLGGLAGELVDNIRFLFKPDEYEWENEARVIVMNYGDSDSSQHLKPWFRFDEVIIGNRVKDPGQLERELKRRAPNLKVTRSEITE